MGRAIEDVYSRRLGDHASELAEHFAHSSNEEDLAKAVAYGEQAAQQAIAVYGYGEAGRLLERALDVQDILDPDDKVRKCDLLLLLAEAIVSVVDPASAQTRVPGQAYRLAEEIGDDGRASAAAQLAMTALTSGRYDEMKEWINRAERYDATDAARARTRSMSAMVLRDEGRRAESRLASREAIEIGWQSGNNDIAVATANTYLMLPTSPALEEAKLKVSQQAIDLSGEGLSTRRLGFIYWNAALEFLVWGDREQADHLWVLLRQLADRTGHTVPANCVLRVDYAFAILDGRFDDALATNAEMLELGGNWEAFETTARQHLGVATPEDEFDRVFGGADFLGPRNRLLARAMNGQTKAAHAQLRRFFNADKLLGKNDSLDTDELVLMLRTALILLEADIVDHMAKQLAEHPRLVVHRWSGPMSVARIIGDAMSFLGRPGEARDFYQTGLEVCERIRFRPEIALIRLGQADLMANHFPGEIGEAREHLSFAIPELTEMKMRPALERAMALQQRLDSAPTKAPAYPDGLTERQVEVLCLLANGKRDSEIAEALVITTRGASNHVAVATINNS